MGRKRVDKALGEKALRRIAERKAEYLELLEADPLGLRDTPLERMYLDLEYVVAAADLLAKPARKEKLIRIDAKIRITEEA